MTMHQTRPSTTDTTLVTAATPGELSDLEAAIMDACNELHDARSSRDDARVRSVTDHLFALVKRYDETDGDNHPNPAWARPNQRALAFSAAGRLEDAVATETLALKYADTPRRKEISLDNLADRCVRLGRFEDAVGYFLDALEVAPTSVPVLLTGAQALHGAGYLEQADAIFASFLQSPEQLAPNGALGAYLDHESRLRAMTADLPSLRALFDAWARVSAELSSDLGSETGSQTGGDA